MFHSHLRTFVRAICIAAAIFASPLYAQESPDVQSQILQIQASLKQIKSDYEQRINALEQQVTQLKQENRQLSHQAHHPVVMTASASKAPPAPASPAQQRVAKTETLEESIVNKLSLIHI